MNPSGIEIVVLSTLVGLVGFWLGWKMSLEKIMRSYPADASTGIGVLASSPDDMKAWREKEEADGRSMRVDAAAVHFAACLAGRTDGTRDPVAIVSEARAMAEVLVAAEHTRTRRSPFFP